MFRFVQKYYNKIGEIDKDLNARKVFNARIYRLLSDNGITQIINPFVGLDDLTDNKQLIIDYIKMYPPMYNSISANLRVDEDILISLAESPLYYMEDDQNKNSILAKSPLSLVIDEHKNRYIGTKRNRDGSIETITGDGLPFVENTTEGVCRIKDFDLIKKALNAELISYSNSLEMYKGYGQLFQYKGIHILNTLRRGEKVDPSKYVNLVSLQLASKEILEDENCKKQIEETIQEWVQSEKAKDKYNKEEAEMLSTDLWDILH